MRLKKKNLKKLKPEVFSQTFWLMKLINKFMRQGKKSKVERLILDSFYEFKKHYNEAQPFLLLFRYLLFYKPMLGLSKIRIGRQIKQIPIPLSSNRQLIFSLNWFIKALKTSSHIHLSKKIYRELENIRANTKPILSRYKETQQLLYNLVTNRVNKRYRWK